MGYYSDLRVAITKKDYIKMLEKDNQKNMCKFILDKDDAYIKEYSKNNVECVLLQQFSLKYYKEFEEIQLFEKYLSEVKNGYVFMRIGGSWDDIEYRNTAKYKELEVPFKFINIIREENARKMNIEKLENKQTKKEYIITNTKEIIEYCKGNKDIINFINEEFYVGTQFKMILNVDALKDEASATLYLRTTMDEKYNILSAETIDIKKALKFLGYQNKEKFLEDLNRVRVNQEEEEFE